MLHAKDYFSSASCDMQHNLIMPTHISSVSEQLLWDYIRDQCSSILLHIAHEGTLMHNTKFIYLKVFDVREDHDLAEWKAVWRNDNRIQIQYSNYNILFNYKTVSITVSVFTITGHPQLLGRLLRNSFLCCRDGATPRLGDFWCVIQMEKRPVELLNWWAGGGRAGGGSPERILWELLSFLCQFLKRWSPSCILQHYPPSHLFLWDLARLSSLQVFLKPAWFLTIRTYHGPNSSPLEFNF